MNSLNVTKFGVQELNAKEMVEVDGGIAPVIVWGGLLIAAVFAAL